ncbi:hypothetical protein GOP47_0019598 [Adiantum capillus-veneris]|uniref:Methyltransferase n=1 Tax=Adiantum capillus-veneris TaxID=13818 RepID=A0A9D4UBC4_ADICA|nr:hypothetical protein GOP47_0019598 [Adiantum capillus-veneris]
MNRTSARGSPAGRGSHVYQLSDELGAHSPANGKAIDDWKFHSNATNSPGGRSLTTSPSVQDHLSPSRPLIRNGDMVNGNGNHRPDYLSSPDSLKPCLETSPLGRGKRGYAVSLGTTMVLCFGFTDRIGDYKQKSSSIRSKDADSSAGFNRERHCQTSNKRKQCLIPPPDEYKLPPRWPESRKGAWHSNMKFVEQLGLSGRRLARLKLEADEIVSLDLGMSHDLDGLENHVQQVLKAVYGNAGSKYELGAILDINCALSRLREQHNSLDKSSILCLAPYEVNGSQVQYALERGYPAFIGSVSDTQLPLPSSSFDMIHVLDSDLDWTLKDGIVLLELDRLLKPGGYFVQVLVPSESSPNGHDQDWQVKKDMASKICWSAVLEMEQTLMWRKPENQSCYSSRGLEAKPKLCGKLVNANEAWYPPLQPCITSSMEKSTHLSQQRQYVGAAIGFSNEEVSDDPSVWAATVKSYWSLLTPLIFSDHPKRPGEEDPPPPSNIVRNILDMNALHGSLNSALLDARKAVWVMNVVPRSGHDTLSLIYKRGLVGLQHDWCEALPTYPRSFDLLHGIGLLSKELGRSNGCGLSTLFLEMDRIMRPEGWVILRDKVEMIEDARIAAGQMRWETRVINVEGLEDQQLLVCQKVFWKARSPSSKVAPL